MTGSKNENWSYLFFKRGFDITIAVLVLFFLSWLLILVWVAVKLQSPGPGFFAQRRVGRHERVFTCYKFRTMSIGTPELGTHQVSDAAITTVGAFLRRTKLDELPQVWNVLCNEMSLVGPRPCLPSQNEVLAHRRNVGVYESKPGITGLSQISQIDMSRPRELAELDQEYVRLQSIKLDIAIIIKTILGKGAGDKITRGRV
jgi:lipopolysaccharide/colanic/teichoic acid biosynthesis glycosyltransferase